MDEYWKPRVDFSAIIARVNELNKQHEAEEAKAIAHRELSPDFKPSKVPRLR